MNNDSESDNEIGTFEHRQIRWAGMIILFFVAGGVACGIAHEEGILKDWQAIALLVGAGTAIVLAAVRCGRRDSRGERRMLDSHQRQNRWNLAIFAGLTVLVGCSLAATPNAVTAHEALKQNLLTAAFALCALGAIAALSFDSRYDDDFVRDLRARAASLGFLVAGPGLVAIFLAARYRPEWNASVVPVLIAMMVAVPALYVILRDWRAGRNG